MITLTVHRIDPLGILESTQVNHCTPVVAALSDLSPAAQRSQRIRHRSELPAAQSSRAKSVNYLVLVRQVVTSSDYIARTTISTTTAIPILMEAVSSLATMAAGTSLTSPGGRSTNYPRRCPQPLVTVTT